MQTRKREPVFVMIPYDIDIGFAIGRLIRVFFEVGSRLAGGAEDVHFSFVSAASGSCPNLPAGFSNLLEFDFRDPDDASLGRFRKYVAAHGIRTIIGLDVSVNKRTERFLSSARQAGVSNIVAYWGAPMSVENTGIRLLLKRLEVRLLRPSRPDLFIFESQAMRHLAVNGRGIPAAATAVIPTGVDPQKFRPAPDRSHIARDRFAIPEGRHIVAYMGHLHARKGVHILMEAICEIVKRSGRHDVHVLFLGNRNGEEEGFRKHWEPAREFITFGGYQSDVTDILAGCFAGCIPSTGWDSFPMSSLEMQACGLPVIVSDWQGVPETVEDGVTGIVVPTGSPVALAGAILGLIDDTARRDRMCAAARCRIEGGFTVDHQIFNLERALRKRPEWAS